MVGGRNDNEVPGTISRECHAEQSEASPSFGGLRFFGLGPQNDSEFGLLYLMKSFII